MDSEFHFLRPDWFWALLPVLGFLLFFWRQRQHKNQWQSLIDPAFHSVLLGQTSRKQTVYGSWIALGLGWVLTVIALAGPTWDKVEMPAEKTRQALVVVQDLSLSMHATDLSPNRLSRARFLIKDHLSQRPWLHAGLVGYAGSAHAITPISESNQTLLTMLPVLDPVIMPTYGADAHKAFALANRMLEGAKITQKHLLWVTDDITPKEKVRLADFVQSHDLHLSILAVGTQTGAPIEIPDYGPLKDSQGRVVTPPLALDDLTQLAKQTQSPLLQLTQAPIDAAPLFPNPLMADTDPQQDQQQRAQWLDQGLWLLWLIIPGVLLSFRRGVLLSTTAFTLLPLGWLWVFFIGMGPASSVWAQEVPQEVQQQGQPEAQQTWPPDREQTLDLLDVLKSGDQQGYEKFQKKDFAGAADRFEDPLWKGVSLYRQGDYQAAVKVLEKHASAQADYNRANALTQMGQWQKAQKAYESALKKRPDFAAAEHNLALVKQLQAAKPPQPKDAPAGQKPGDNQAAPDQTPPKQADSGQQGQQSDQAQTQGQGGQGSAPNSSSQNEPNPPSQAPKNPTQTKGQKTDAEATDKTQADNLGQANDPNEKPTSSAQAQTDKPNAQHSADQQASDKQAQASDAEKAKARESAQAQSNWLNQIPDQPALFLQRKFDYQYQQQQSGDEPTDRTQDNGKIW